MKLNIECSSTGMGMPSQPKSAPRHLGLVLVMGMLVAATSQAAQLAADKSSTEGVLPSQPSADAMRADQIISEMIERNHSRDLHLRQYLAVRTYEVTNDKGKVHAKTVVLAQYQAPGSKTFVTISEEGSRIVRRYVFKGLMDSEIETAAGRSHRDSSIGPTNYAFDLLGEEDVDGYHCFVLQAFPKRRDKYLFEGKIWIDTQDFAVVKIVGRPAKNPSFWITRVDFVRRYQKIGELWFPLKDESVTHVRIYGKKILTIDHADYKVNEATSADDQTRIASDNGQPATPRSQTLERPVREALDWRAETRPRSGSRGNR